MLQFISMEEAYGEIEKRASRRLIPTALVHWRMRWANTAEPAVAKLSIPPFNNSARDGVVLSASGLSVAKGGGRSSSLVSSRGDPWKAPMESMVTLRGS